jgi:hypothetical protein
MSAVEAPVCLELERPVPAQVPVGADVALKVRAADAAGSDLRGGMITIMAADRDVTSAALTQYRDGVNETDELFVKAPFEPGEADWRVVFPRQEIDGVAYEESVLPISFRAVPHQTSLAVWAVPSPVRIGERFRITVGAKSSGDCALAGAKVEVLDAAGAAVGQATLGETPWPGTGALYWAEIALTAPADDGLQAWSVAFAAKELELPHVGAATRFGFAAVKPPAHRLTVKTIEEETADPVDEVQVGLGPYRAATDGAGTASIAAPAGRYNLAVWKPGFEAAPISIEIAADTQVQIELKRLPEEVKIWG